MSTAQGRNKGARVVTTTQPLATNHETKPRAERRDDNATFCGTQQKHIIHNDTTMSFMKQKGYEKGDTIFDKHEHRRRDEEATTCEVFTRVPYTTFNDAT